MVVYTSCTLDAISLKDAHRNHEMILLEHFQNASITYDVTAIAHSKGELVETIKDQLLEAMNHIDSHMFVVAPD